MRSVAGSVPTLEELDVMGFLDRMKHKIEDAVQEAEHREDKHRHPGRHQPPRHEPPRRDHHEPPGRNHHDPPRRDHH